MGTQGDVIIVHPTHVSTSGHGGVIICLLTMFRKLWGPIAATMIWKFNFDIIIKVILRQKPEWKHAFDLWTYVIFTILHYCYCRCSKNTYSRLVRLDSIFLFMTCTCHDCDWKKMLQLLFCSSPQVYSTKEDKSHLMEFLSIFWSSIITTTIYHAACLVASGPLFTKR